MFGHHFWGRGHCGDFRTMGRHRGGRGFGGWGGGMGGGLDGEGFRWGRKLGSSDLQLILLALLAEKPSHGYELIKALEERSGGFYSPSPGMVYPALTYLEEIGHASVVVEGTKKRYEITPEGIDHLKEHGAMAAAILEQLGRVGAKMQKVREFFTGEGDSAEGEREGRHADMHEARDALKSAIRAKHRCSPEEAERVAAILRRAAEDIIGGKK
ncbi:hypothetical protein BWI17_07210 [Betaproteobacteria bacterium GR16-43]|nr:hypothetical protein BWI17_07210 [Betaproteobacteria bacterium GR16-43]